MSEPILDDKAKEAVHAAKNAALAVAVKEIPVAASGFEWGQVI